MKNLRTMMYSYAFIDIGSIAESHSYLIKKRAKKGYGLGLGIILPYMKAIRLELAMDDYKNRTWALEVGLPF